MGNWVGGWVRRKGGRQCALPNGWGRVNKIPSDWPFLNFVLHVEPLG